MARREWDPELLEQVLSRLEGCPHSSLSGRSGRLVHELRRSSELKTLWSAFEAHENGPWGARLADRHAIHSFLDWARRRPEYCRRGPPDYRPGDPRPMSDAQLAVWLRQMSGTRQAPALRAKWSLTGGRAWFSRADGFRFSRPWSGAPCGYEDNICCDFLLNRCAIGDLCTRTHGPSPFGLVSFMALPRFRYGELFAYPGAPHGVLLALHLYRCTHCRLERLWFHFPVPTTSSGPRFRPRAVT